MPHELTPDEMAEIKAEFVASARRAEAAGFDLLELHCAHGYLLSSFISPLTNQRTDEYGGSLANRLRYPLEVFAAIRAGLARGQADDRADLRHRLGRGRHRRRGRRRDRARVRRRGRRRRRRLDRPGDARTSSPAYGRSFQTPFADAIRNRLGIATIAVGAISSYDDVNSLILAGRADLCALGRVHLYDPSWTLHAAVEQDYDGPGARWPLPWRAGRRKPPARPDRRARSRGCSWSARASRALRHRRWRP